ncbi:MAG: integrase core domain-containing protein, partial [Nitrososphaerales archaeon]
VGTVRRECLDRLLIISRRQLESVLAVYIGYYNEHRPHRALAQRPPAKAPAAAAPGALGEVRRLEAVRRVDRLGGLIHEYHLAA